MKKAVGLIVLAIFLASCGGSGGSSQSSQQSSPVTLSTSPNSQQNIDQGQTVSFTATLTNDTSNQGVTWSLSGTGCSGSSCGTLTNTTATAATYNAPATVSSALTVTVKATSAKDSSVTQSVTVVVSPAPTVTTTSTSLPGGTAGVAYSGATLQASGGSGTLSWSITSGSLPGGLTLNASTGIISGTPSDAGTFTFTVQVTDSASSPLSAQQQLTITIANPAMAIVTTSLTDGTVSVAYNATLQVNYAIQPVTWSIVTGSLPSGLTLDASTGAISGIPTAAGTATFTVQVTDSTTPTPQQKTQQLSLAINASGAKDSVLKGNYAFLMRGCDTKAPNLSCVAMAGSLVADGAGNITAGVQDINDVNDTAAETNLTFTGTYAVGSDNRGVITITNSAAETYSMAIALGAVTSGISAKGAILEFDSSGYTISGEIDLQDTTAFSQKLSGNYVFDLSGADDICLRMSMAGAFTADGSGSITSGVFDLNDDGNIISTDTSIGSPSTYTSGDAAGRNQIQIGGLSPASVNYVYYIVSATRMLVMSTDPGPSSGVVTGELDAQAAGPFSNSSLSATTVTSIERVASGGFELMLGLVTFDGSGNFTYSFDDNKTGTLTTQSGMGTYNVVDTATGRFTLTPNGSATMVGYLIQPNQGVIVNADGSVASGAFQQQAAGPFTNSSLNGTYYFGSEPFTDKPAPPPQGDPPASLSLDVVTFDGSGNLTVTDDTNQLGTLLPDQTATDTYSVESNGRVTLGSNSVIAYIISSTQAVIMSTSADDPNPTLGFGQQ